MAVVTCTGCTSAQVKTASGMLARLFHSGGRWRPAREMHRCRWLAWATSPYSNSWGTAQHMLPSQPGACTWATHMQVLAARVATHGHGGADLHCQRQLLKGGKHRRCIGGKEARGEGGGLCSACCVPAVCMYVRKAQIYGEHACCYNGTELAFSGGEPRAPPPTPNPHPTTATTTHPPTPAPTHAYTRIHTRLAPRQQAHQSAPCRPLQE